MKVVTHWILRRGEAEARGLFGGNNNSKYQIIIKDTLVSKSHCA